MTALEVILAYREAGWSIVPAAIEGKRALVPWRHWQQVAAGPEQLAEWQRRYPRCNWAVITGQLSGVVVIDIDVRHRGDRALAELEQIHGDLPWLAVVETPSGGWHVYLRHPGGRIPNSASRIGLGIDPRGDNGLALLPFSRRADGTYRWAVGGPDTVPPMPDSWAQLLRPAPKDANQGTRTAPGTDSPPVTSRRLVGILAALQRAPEGQRNSTLYWCGRRLGEMVDQGAPGHWRQLLTDTALACGLEPVEIQDTLDSALGVER
jgi:hypothetical protein